ncbi:Signal recognition particle 19 kDa protein [Taenia crassiceps]|uniref:Signal recognition particle 19 kDa protein n=1 Tax=Taenia crassiceps TaxID=6207 RepID=A0ABR4QQX9_9CEST
MDPPASKPFSPSTRHSEKERWICIYPVYLNSRVTRAKGRKVSVKQGVDNPKHSEICAILQNLGLRHLAENKRDPAETQNRWRVRVQLKNDDGSPCMPEHAILVRITDHKGKVVRERLNGDAYLISVEAYGK